jgi:peptidoglycan hydrolase-like protein with peptidoglycan-binding domain
MKANAGRFGWKHPYWARQGGGRAEPWHWEFVGGGSTANRVLRPKWNETGLGNSGAKVRKVQQLLNKIGAPKYRVVEDGKYGLGTAVTVMKYQWVKGLPGTGVVDATTLKHLEGKVSSTPTPKPTTKKAPSTLPVIKQGSKGGWVGLVQSRVGVKVDADFGPRTKLAVQRVQRQQNIDDDGVVGPRTWMEFVAGGVKKGSTGVKVKIVQNIVGLSGPKADGVFGPGTKAELEKVQRYLGVPDDGVFGPKTRSAILRHWNK